MTQRKARLTCPICRRPVQRSDPEFPFCSERCRVVDLGNWASGKYRIAAPLPDSEEAASEFIPGETSGDDSSTGGRK